ncbi:cell wall hydrolase [Aureibacillus halotolerans]|uniref:N-acetylmuramoyl-L-alanine amidase n=1 Tax=Aureibacillus halotolerans TaxID=1508390 RepID=A0A4R6U4Q6_9BACI|nr:cell wall hydrolase [Aureibacillus halotolerans]TDQ41448.1 N-acetylmuramoyl-L-alanine amidase [Aureibacillus halotolerans]
MKAKMLLFTIFCSVFLLLLSPFQENMYTFAMSSAKEDIADLQDRLSSLGFSPGNQTGVLTEETKQAIVQFQKSNELPSSGSVSEQTKRELHMATLTKEDVQMMAKIVYGEARGESLKGQVAVAAVIINRLQADGFPNTIEDIIFQKNAFTAISDGQYQLTPDEEAYEAVYYAIRGWDPTGRALYYYNPDIATSQWIFTRNTITRIGQHVFAQ